MTTLPGATAQTAQHMHPWMRYALIAALAGVSLLSAYIVVAHFDLATALGEDGQPPRYVWDRWAPFALPQSIAIMVVVFFAGMLGATIHGMNSLAGFFGNRRLYHSWWPWFVFRPLVGASVALGFYFVLRAGLILPSNAGEVNVYGFVALGFMAGLFSKQLVDKLKETFDTLFNSNQDAQRQDGLVADDPVLEILRPDRLDVGARGEALVVTLVGQNLPPGSRALVNGEPRVTRRPTEGDDTHLTVELTETDVAEERTLQITVRTSDSMTSNALPLTVASAAVDTPPGDGDGGQPDMHAETQAGIA